MRTYTCLAELAGNELQQRDRVTFEVRGTAVTYSARVGGEGFLNHARENGRVFALLGMNATQKYEFVSEKLGHTYTRGLWPTCRDNHPLGWSICKQLTKMVLAVYQLTEPPTPAASFNNWVKGDMWISV